MLLLATVTRMAFAVPHIYVSTGGNQVANYDSWDHAFTNFQEAMEYVMTSAPTGANLYLAGEIFEAEPLGAAHPSNTVFLLQTVSNITMRGGYEAASGSGSEPGTNNPALWPTTLRRTDGNARVLTMSGVSNAVIESVTIRDGYRPSGSQGGGIRLSDCTDVAFVSCAIDHNETLGRGAGVYAVGCQGLRFIDSTIASNRIPSGSGRGGGIYLQSSTAVISNSLIAANRAGGTYHNSGHAGGVYIETGSQVQMYRSTLQDNIVYGDYYSSYGGGLFVESGASLMMRESILTGNRAAQHRGSNPNYGGAIDNAGTLVMRNCLVIGNRSDSAHSDGIWSDGAGAHALIENCTVTDNHSVGIRYGAGTIAVSNTIVWGHDADLLDFPEDAQGRLLDVWYSNIGDGQNTGYQGCHSVDPVFADREHYHLQSTEGHYTNGFFSGGFWTNAAANSPLIDRGDPASAWDREPLPNGGRINMGAYGNTDVAALTPQITVDPPLATNLGALAWGHRTAVLRGQILDDGGDFCEVTFQYWQAGDNVTNDLSMGVRLEGIPFEYAISGLMPGQTYHYRVSAINSAAMTYSQTMIFSMHPAASALFVATNGNHTAGTNWSTAYRDLQTAFSILENDDTLYIAGNLFADAPAFGNDYVYRLQGLTNIMVLGGYAAMSDEELPGARDGVLWPTRISRTEGNARILSMTGLSNAVIEQVTIRDGYRPSGSQGGGIRLSDCTDVAFVSCAIDHNETLGRGAGVYAVGCQGLRFIDSTIASNRIPSGSGRGGGIYLQSSTAVISNSLIAANRAGGTYHNSGHAGGVYIETGSQVQMYRSTLRDNIVYGDYFSSYGGGLFIESGASLTMRESILTGNRAAQHRGSNPNYGGAIDNAGTLVMRNCLVIGNRSDSAHSDGIWSDGAGAHALIENCTVTDNHSVGIRYGAGTIAVSNTIVWGHDADLLDFPEDGGILSGVAYSLFATPDTMGDVNGCINADPGFIDAASANYRLRNAFGVGDPAETSPAIDAGINLPWMHGTVDLDGNNRIMMGRMYGVTAVDMGAYEALSPRGSLFNLR